MPPRPNPASAGPGGGPGRSTPPAGRACSPAGGPHRRSGPPWRWHSPARPSAPLNAARVRPVCIAGDCSQRLSRGPRRHQDAGMPRRALCCSRTIGAAVALGVGAALMLPVCGRRERRGRPADHRCGHLQGLLQDLPRGRRTGLRRAPARRADGHQVPGRRRPDRPRDQRDRPDARVPGEPVADRVSARSWSTSAPTSGQ